MMNFPCLIIFVLISFYSIREFIGLVIPERRYFVKAEGFGIDS